MQILQKNIFFGVVLHGILGKLPQEMNCYNCLVTVNDSLQFFLCVLLWEIH